MAIRITALVKRRPDITHEEFIQRWSTQHAEIFTSLEAVKKNIVRYSQFHVFQDVQLPGFPAPLYDGAAEFLVEKIEDLTAILTDAGYIKYALPDEENFLDRKTPAQILVGEDHVKWQKE